MASENKTISIGIVGSRNYRNYDVFKNRVKKDFDRWGFSLNDITIVTGDADGVDSLARRFSRDYLNKTIVGEQADWKTYGKAAGPIRNTAIIEQCEYLIAFPSKNGRGTQDSINKFQRKFKDEYETRQKIHWVD